MRGMVADSKTKTAEIGDLHGSAGPIAFDVATLFVRRPCAPNVEVVLSCEAISVNARQIATPPAKSIRQRPPTRRQAARGQPRRALEDALRQRDQIV